MKPTVSNPQFWYSLLLLAIVASSFSVELAAAGTDIDRSLAGSSPFTAKASLIRYWKKKVSNNLPKSFFLEKASPLDAVQLATFSEIVGQQLSSTQLSSFCKAADLFCFPDLGTSLAKHSKDVNFAEYKFQNFTNYGTDRRGGVDSFKNYTNNENFPDDTFRRYSRGSVDHDDRFTGYGLNSSVARDTFNSYGTKATSGTGDFSKYQDGTTIVNLNFTSYSDSTVGRTQEFTSYGTNTTVGDEGFVSYGKNGDGATNKFSNYGNVSSTITSFFNNYQEAAKQGNDNFTSYGLDERIPENDFNNYANDGNGTTEAFSNYGRDGDIPLNNFNTYGSGGNEITQKFSNYRDFDTGLGDNRFRSYGEDSKAESLGFTNYGRSFIDDTFREYGKHSRVKKVDFKTYRPGNTFVEYTKTGVTFSNYLNDTESPLNATATSSKKINSRRVEPGKFFREKMLKTGTVMPMPDIKDKMPKRSFLPRIILSKLPFSTNRIDELKKIFHADDDSSMTKILTDALTECERAPSPGETKRCAGSAEDMIDFATSVLGKNVVVRSTENTQGSGGNIMIGSVAGINGGQITKSVSCHQSLYPYLLYYCHSVPKVRVYEADILDPKSKDKINHGVAICHIDTSSWSQNHGAFIALGSGPGKIEVCHWIFQNDMTWTISD